VFKVPFKAATTMPRKEKRPKTGSARPRIYFPPNYYLEDLEKREIWTAVQQTQGTNCDVLMVGDSIIKYIDNLSNCQVISYRGIKASQLGARILHGKVPWLLNKRLCIIHAGTNNMESDSVTEILNQLYFIVDTIRLLVPGIIIVLTHILPRPIDWYFTGDKLLDLNTALRGKAREWDCELIPCSKIFYDGLVPNNKLFTQDDMLHLSRKGTKALQRYVGRVLGNIKHRHGIPKAKDVTPTTMIWSKIRI
jgi:lysophospholipase L1-like esterase